MRGTSLAPALRGRAGPSTGPAGPDRAAAGLWKPAAPRAVLGDDDDPTREDEQVSDAPGSPRAARLAVPRWLDGRLVLGVLLVLGSVLLGARVLATADRSQQVWAATRDLAPGSTLGTGDLRKAKVRLFDAGDRYLVATGRPPAGYVLTRGVGAAELLPRGSLVAPEQAATAELRDVSVPVEAGHLPEDLQAGQQVDVFVTAGAGTSGTAAAPGAAPSPGTAGAANATRRVLSAAPVRLRPRDGGLAAARSSSVVLSVGAGDAERLVSALQEGRVDLVRVPRDRELTPLSATGPSPTR